MKLKYVDFHCHTTLHPFSKYQTIDSHKTKKRDKVSLWKQIPPFGNNPSSRALFFTQSDLTSMSEGGVKIALTAMYAFEQGWFRILKRNKNSEQKFLFKKMKQLEPENLKLQATKNVKVAEKDGVSVESHFQDFIRKIFWGFKVLHEKLRKRVVQVLSPQYNYRNELIAELNFLENKCLTKNGITPKIPKSNFEFLKFLEEPSTMIIISTIEGANGFIDGNDETIENGKVNFGRDIKDEKGNVISHGIIDTIEKIKREHKVFFVTLSHHFYNGFSGHSQSIYGSSRAAIDQMFGKGNTINENGQKIIACLLGIGEFKDNGYRILIDTKHLSLAARMQYCSFIENYNKANPDDIIPIITSHSAFAGQDKIGDIGIISGDYSSYEINIATEEIVAIYNSKGIIGINFDQDVLSEKPKKTKTDDWNDEQWAALIADNLMGMVEAFFDFKNTDDISQYKDIWKLFAIGSDFDGFINPMDNFATAAKFPNLEKALIRVLPKYQNFEKFSFDYSAKEIVKMFMRQNAIDFLKKHYMTKPENIFSAANDTEKPA